MRHKKSSVGMSCKLEATLTKRKALYKKKKRHGKTTRSPSLSTFKLTNMNKSRYGQVHVVVTPFVFGFVIGIYESTIERYVNEVKLPSGQNLT